MRKIFALFRNPVSYIDPLLEKFAERTELFVAFSVNKPHQKDSLCNVKHVFLENAENEKFQEGADYGLIQKDVKKYIRENCYEVVFLATSYWSLTTWFALWEAKRKKLPVMTRMTAVVERKRSIITRAIKKVLVGKYCNKMNAGVYECEEQKNYLLKYGMKPEQLFFAPCAVDNVFFSAQKAKYSKEEIRRELKIDKNTIVIAFTGQLIERKRPFDIIQAVKNLADEGCNLTLLLIGSGGLEEELKNYITKNKLENRIWLCGKVDHEKMSQYLCASDIYVLPSEYDASPKALNEAMNFELPIIVSDGVKTARELCEIDGNGYVFTVGDVEQLTDHIRKFVDNPEKINVMGKKSKEIVSRFSFDTVVDAWLDAIEYCIKGKGGNECG